MAVINHQNNFATNLTSNTSAGATTSPINSIPTVDAPYYLAFDATNLNSHYEVLQITSDTATNVNHAATTYDHTTDEEVRMVIPAEEMDDLWSGSNITGGLADGEYKGIVENGTAGATLIFGDLVALDVTDSRWEKTDANVAAAATGDARGKIGVCVLAAAADGSATTVLLYGTVRANAAFPAMTVNDPLYVSGTAGDITHTAPSATDDVVRVVGFANTADELFFCPSTDYVTHI